MKAVAVNMKLKLKEHFVICEASFGNYAKCFLLYITIILSDSDIHIFLNGDALLTGSRAEMDAMDEMEP